MNSPHGAIAPTLAALRVVTLSNDAKRTHKLIASLSEAGVTYVREASSLEQVLSILDVDELDIIVAELHPTAPDALRLPAALKVHPAFVNGKIPPRVLWTGEFSPGKPSTESGSWLGRAAKVIDCRESARVGSLNLQTLDAHARQARRQGIHVQIIRSAGPLGLQSALHALMNPGEVDVCEQAAPQGVPPSDEDIIEALFSGQGLSVVFQPQYDLHSRAPVGAEALIRWHHRSCGAISPASFLPSVQRLGLDLVLFSFVRARTLEALRQLNERGAAIPIAINISQQALCTPDFPEHLAHAVRTAGLPANLIKLELTEESKVDDPLRLATALNTLRLQGFKLSLDDFGNGSATLEMIAGHPFDEIKIDASLVRDLEAHAPSRAIVAAVLELAKLFDLAVVAEGVASDASWATLRRMGCKTGQGYALSHPLPTPEFLHKLLSTSPA